MSGGRYRYYWCRKTYSGRFEEKCDSQYIRVERLEGGSAARGIWWVVLGDQSDTDD